ncbi:MAG TPA: MIP/aquaporin family protein [bacterium]|nr:MIP/aquaporin family protein [bacterium]
MPSHGAAPTLSQRALAEFIGTALLVMAVIGSGIAAARLSPHDTGLQLLENAAATAAALTAVILAVGPVSGAHLNPAVTLADWRLGGISGPDGLMYGLAQIGGGVAGAVLANMMFALPAVEISATARWGAHLWLSEVIATFGLLLVIFGGVRSGRTTLLPIGVGAYIGGAYWFTSSTSFANPAVTIARTLSNTFAGIAPRSAGPFLAAQVAGALLAIAVVRVLYPAITEGAR